MYIDKIDNAHIWQTDLEQYDYSLFISPEWVSSFRNEHRTPVYFNFIENDVCIIKLAGIRIDDIKPFRRKLFFHAGPALKIGLSKSYYIECLRLLASYAKRSGVGRVSMLSYDFKDQISVRNTFHFDTRHELIIDLNKEREELDRTLTKDVKRRYRKAVEKGFYVREVNTTEMIDTLVLLLNETKSVRLSKGYNEYNPFYVPLLDKEVTKNILKNKALRIFVAYLGDQIHAISVNMVRERKAVGLLLGITAEGYQNGVSSFVDYYQITQLNEDGYQYLNLGGISLDKTHSGLLKYKKSLGAYPVASTYGSTNFLVFPYSLGNPLMSLGRLLPDNKIVKLLQRQL